LRVTPGRRRTSCVMACPGGRRRPEVCCKQRHGRVRAEVPAGTRARPRQPPVGAPASASWAPRRRTLHGTYAGGTCFRPSALNCTLSRWATQELKPEAPPKNPPLCVLGGAVANAQAVLVVPRRPRLLCAAAKHRPQGQAHLQQKQGV
jgi:hypothetical protein